MTDWLATNWRDIAAITAHVLLYTGGVLFMAYIWHEGQRR